MLVLSLTGSLNLVLGAKGKVAGLYFAIINSALYAYQCLGIPLYGEVMYNVLYSIPVSATAIYLWNRNATSDGEVRFRTMTPKLMAGVAAATALLIIVMKTVNLLNSLYGYMNWRKISQKTAK